MGRTEGACRGKCLGVQTRASDSQMSHEDLEAQVKGKICGQCRSLPQVAWHERDWHIRCDCGYDEAVLVAPRYVLPTSISHMQRARRRKRS